MARLIPLDDEELKPENRVKAVPVDEPKAQNKGSGRPVSEGLKRGVLDVGQGMKQLYLMATDPEAAKSYTDQVNREIAAYEASRGQDAGFDWARLGGSVAATAPAMFIPGGQAGLLARLGMGALAGSISGAANFSEAGTWEDKALQGGLGAVTGAVAPEAVRLGVKGVVGAGQAASNVGRKALGATASNADILADIQRAGSQIDNGFDLGKMSADIRDRLLADAKAQLKTSGQLDADALLRSQDYAKLGVKPTMAQLSRDPRQWQTERNLAQVQGVGDELLNRFSEQPGVLLKNLEGMRTGTATTPIEAGQAAMDVIGSRVKKSGVYGELGKRIDDIYTEARSAPGAQAEIPFKPFKTQISSVIEQFEDKIPAPIVKRLGDFDDPKGTRYFSVAEAAKFRELLNARIADGDPAQAKALGAIKRELDAYMSSVGESVGDEGVEAIKLFQRGTQASAKRAQEFSAPPLSQTVAGEVQPDDFFKRFVLNAKVSDLNQLKSNLTRADVPDALRQSGAEAWENLRGQTIQYLINKASPDGQAFSQANYRRALESIGPRMEVLFSPEERGMLFTLQRASQNLFSQPATGGIPLVNQSGTGAAIANMMQKASAIPGAGTVLQASANAIREQAQMNAAQQALMGGVGGAAAAQRAANQQGSRAVAASIAANPFGLQPFATAVPSLLEVDRDMRPRSSR
jgi:hypothetical protein